MYAYFFSKCMCFSVVTPASSSPPLGAGCNSVGRGASRVQNPAFLGEFVRFPALTVGPWWRVCLLTQAYMRWISLPFIYVTLRHTWKSCRHLPKVSGSLRVLWLPPPVITQAVI